MTIHFQLQPILFTSAPTVDQTVSFRNETPDYETIQLIGWKWDEVGKYFVVIVFFLMGAFVKIIYHNTRWLKTQIPESW